MPKFRPITLTPATAELKPGETQDLATTGGPVKSWTTSNSAVATLVGGGKVRGRSAGDAVITAKGGPYAAQTLVTVLPLAPIEPPVEPPIEPPIEPEPPPESFGRASSSEPASSSDDATLTPAAHRIYIDG